MCSWPTRNRKIKKFKNLENTFIASFQAKIGWEMPQREKIIKIILMGFYPTRNRKFQLNSKKIRKHHHTFFSSQNRLGKAEKERKEKKKSFWCVPTRPVIENSKKSSKKIIIPISSYPTRNREFQKNSKKIQIIEKHCYGFLSCENKLGKVDKEWK